MSKLLFKKGSYSDFKSKVVTGNKAVEGALYLTEDEGGLYVGLNGGGVKRIQGSVLFFNTLAEFTAEIAPPYSTDVIYFIAENNALVRWTGETTKWKQLNATASEVTSSLNSLQTQIDSVSAIANNALPMSGTPSGKTMTGNIDMGSKKITNLGAPSADADAATKKYVDDKDAALLGKSTDSVTTATIHGALNAAAAAKTQADKGVSDASAANTAAGAAQNRADAAYALAEKKATMAEVEAKNYATKTEAQGYANAVLGDTDDDLTDKTVYGAIALANKARQEAGAADTVAQAAVKRAGDTMTGNFNMGGTNTVTGLKAPNADSDAATKKYVDDAKTAALAASKVVQDNLDGLDTIVDGIDTRLQQAESDIGAHDTQIAAINTKDAEQDAAIAKNTKAASDAATAASNANTNANSRLLQSEFNTFKSGYNTTISGINTKVSSVETVANAALPKTGGDVSGNINLTNGATITNVPAPTANGHAANKKYVDDAKAEAKAYTDSQLAANDAMTFKGVINSSTDLPLTAGSANVGDTYKVGTAGNYKIASSGTLQAAKVGDLFINNADKDADAPNWVHISSGYEDDYLQRLKAHSDGTIFITDGVNETYSTALSNQKLGTVKVIGDTNSSVAVETEMDGNNNITVTVSIEWGSF